MEKNETIISFKDVYKSFEHSKEPVLNGVNLDIFFGQLTYILGGSGAGKSVLLKHILGLLQPDSGEVWVNGANLRSLSSKEKNQFPLQLGMLFQNAALFDDLTVFENVAFPLREHTTWTEEEIQKEVYHTLALLKMTDGYHKFPNELSGGMKKRVGLARAIIRKPSILLYDEPTTGLDPITRLAVDQLIDELKTKLKLTSVVISHDVASAVLLADRIAFLDHGKIVFFGSAESFQASTHPCIQAFLKSEYRYFKDKAK